MIFFILTLTKNLIKSINKKLGVIKNSLFEVDNSFAEGSVWEPTADIFGRDLYDKRYTYFNARVISSKF